MKKLIKHLFEVVKLSISCLAMPLIIGIIGSIIWHYTNSVLRADPSDIEVFQVTSCFAGAVYGALLIIATFTSKTCKDKKVTNGIHSGLLLCSVYIYIHILVYPFVGSSLGLFSAGATAFFFTFMWEIWALAGRYTEDIFEKEMD